MFILHDIQHIHIMNLMHSIFVENKQTLMLDPFYDQQVNWAHI